MEASALVGVVLTSTVVASVLSVFSTLHVTGRNELSDNVIKHRANWRDAIRALAREITQAVGSGNVRAVRVSRNQLAIRLNPLDSDDQALLQAVRALEACPSAERHRKLEEIERRIALLLKHDWERAKWEARIFHFMRRAPKRVPYSTDTSEAASVNPGHHASKFKVFGAWCIMVGAAAGLFFLAAGLLKPFTNLVIAFNDEKQHHDASAWAGFVLTAVAAGFIWSMLHLAFKVYEKKLVDNITRSAS